MTEFFLLSFKSFIHVYITYKIKYASYKILQTASCLVWFRSFPSLQADALAFGHAGTKHTKCPSPILYRAETKDTEQDFSYTEINGQEITIGLAASLPSLTWRLLWQTG